MKTFVPGLAFVLIMAQPNMATGIMPLYRSEWDLAPLLITVIFAAYLFALVPTLTTVGRPKCRDGWWWRIAVGVGCAVVADIVMAAASDAGVACIARVAAGVSVGLVTGSISGLVLQRAGERGRTVMATATVLGSAVGTLGAALCAQYLPAPQVTVYLVHAVMVSIVVALLFPDHSTVDRSTPRPSAPGNAASDDAIHPDGETQGRAGGYLCGVAAWISAGLVVALLPTYGAEILRTHNLALLALPVTIYLLAAWSAQRLVAPQTTLSRPVTAQVIIILGVAILALLPIIPSLGVLVAGGVVAGVGQGLAYRSGIGIVSAGTDPAGHAQAASRYAGIAYLAAAVATIGFGAIATVWSMPAAIVSAVVVLGAIVVATHVVSQHKASTQRPSDLVV